MSAQTPDAGPAIERATSLPPGPRLPVAIQTYLYWGYADHYLRACHRRYGDAFTVRAFPAGTRVFLADPKDIKTVFTGDPEVFHAGEANAVLKPVMGSRSVLLIDGEEHIAQRRRMLPAFHGDSVSNYRDVVEAATHAEIDRWAPGRPFQLMDAMRRVTLEVILRAVIGAKDPQRLSALRETLPHVADVSGTVMLLWIRPELGRVGPWRRYRQAQARADDLLYQEIAEHRADPGLDQRTDVLSLLMHQEQSDPAGPNDRNLRDQLVTLLLAGHETTTTALAWAFERLLRHPDVLSRLSESIAAGEEEYLDAVVKEILRLRPVIHDVGRVLTVPTEIAGHCLPAGTVVSPSIGLVQSADANFPDADAFAPERFLDAQAPPYSWIPFGGGSRRCLGAAFATLEMKTVLRTILSRTQLQPVGARSEGTTVRHITLVPSRGGKVRLLSRTRFQAPRDSATDPDAASPPQETATKRQESKMGQRSATIDRDAPSIPLADPGLRPATAEDIERLKAVMAEAFIEDPIYSWLMPEDTKRPARLRRYFAIELRHLGLARGRVWTSSNLTGAALSLPPGAWRSPLHITLLEGSAFGAHLDRAARMGAAMEWRHMRHPLRQPHYYIRDVGVLPDMQGQGLGSALMRPTLERCDREGLPAYIEASSERNAALYERLGFQLIRELRVGGSPPLRLMLRPPHPAR